MLAGQLGANLILLNCNNTISAVSYSPVIPVINDSLIWFEERKSGLKEMSNHLKKYHSDAFPHRRRPVITTIIKEGDLTANVKDVLKHHRVEMTVMGSRSGTPAEHFLFGSDTKSIVDHSPIPVLVVPRENKIQSTIRIVFATDFLDQDVSALDYIGQLRVQLRAHLEIVHIQQYGRVASIRNQEVQQKIDEMWKAEPVLVTYNQVYGKNVVSRLNKYCKDNNADILALSHQHHSLLFQAFRKGVADRSLSTQRVPLLLIPELRKEHEIQADKYKGLSNIIF